jgi:glycogen phosphorylase
MNEQDEECTDNILVEDDRTGLSTKTLKRAFRDHVEYSRGRSFERSTKRDKYFALALVVRDRIMPRWKATLDAYGKKQVKRVYYLSAEFLPGRILGCNLLNLDLLEEMRAVLKDLDIDLTDLLEKEPDAGLGNGGLGRLAACFLDSMATMGLPGVGYGIRYEFGIFEQAIRAGYQVEKPDEWLRFGNPWEFERPEHAAVVRFNGRTRRFTDLLGRERVQWVDTNAVVGIPYDSPVVGYGRNNVNSLRLWSARASEEFDLEVFNTGDYDRAVYDKTNSETISKVLYPNDSVQVGRELRLRQQYFFVACSIADILRRFEREYRDISDLPKKVAIQLNDTHPSIAIPELMRILVDERALPWEKAWEITQQTFAYTNHTLLSEALERWSVELFEKLLPRHLEIIYEINQRFMRQVQIRFGGDDQRTSRMSLIEESPARTVRMAHLAVVGSHCVNGVAALHTSLLKSKVFKDFDEMYPGRFTNKTNGVTPRRWLKYCNPALASLITDEIGDAWITDLHQLQKLAPLAKDAQFQQKIANIKLQNKIRLKNYLVKKHEISLNEHSIFDIQVKRIHEYKRQLLNALAIVALYLRMRRNKESLIHPQTFLFGGKAAPGYVNAKLIIRLIHGIAEVVNTDPMAEGLSVYFIPNYRVSLAERLIPACDISEQISTAGKEASGTGNMKFAMNGALTLGTLDGANIEIRESVGEDAFFLFGLKAEEVQEYRQRGYRPRDYVETNQELAEVLELVRDGFFSPEKRNLFHGIVDDLLNNDPYMVLADFGAYMEARERIVTTYKNQSLWSELSIRNIAASGPFSSDRTINEYATEIWNIAPTDVDVPTYHSDDHGEASSLGVLATSSTLKSLLLPS